MHEFDKQAFLEDMIGRRRITEEGCWEWTGSIGAGKPKNKPNGYGVVYYPPNRRRDYVHRLAWSLSNNKEIPRGMFIMHLCDNTICFNPDHLALGTPRDNTQDSISKGRFNQPGKRKFTHRRYGKNGTECRSGHEYTSENTYLHKKDDRIIYRSCRICRRISARKTYLKQRKLRLENGSV